MKKNITILITLITIYFLLKYLIPYGGYIIYPITLLVTFLHEFGHSFFALFTGGLVDSVQINSDWSGYAVTRWWITSIVLIWWYIWSAIFWNLLLYIWTKKEALSEIVIYILASLMIFTWIFWFNSIFSSIILFLIAIWTIFLAKKTKYDSIILQFLWITSLLYIIEDFNVWPSSDISKFSDIFIIIPEFVWMIIWLWLVLFITFLNLKVIFKK